MFHNFSMNVLYEAFFLSVTSLVFSLFLHTNRFAIVDWHLLSSEDLFLLFTFEVRDKSNSYRFSGCDRLFTSKSANQSLMHIQSLNACIGFASTYTAGNSAKLIQFHFQNTFILAEFTYSSKLVNSFLSIFEAKYKTIRLQCFQKNCIAAPSDGFH